jgi:hypothetical protein
MTRFPRRKDGSPVTHLMAVITCHKSRLLRVSRHSERAG